MKCTYEHITSVRVRYGETDQMGYCYYGNYATFFEVGRVEALRAIGLIYKQLEVDGYMLPVSHFEVDYLKPAFYDDELFVKTAIIELRGPRLFFEYEITNQQRQLICTGKTTLFFVAKEGMRPIAPPDSLNTALKEFYAI